MLLRNLVQPEWVTIDCNSQCTTHMLCTTDMTDFHKSISENLTKPDSAIYEKNCIFKEKLCYIFLVTTNGQKFGNKPEMFPFDTNEKTISFLNFFLMQFLEIFLQFLKVTSSLLLHIQDNQMQCTRNKSKCIHTEKNTSTTWTRFQVFSSISESQ